MSHRPVVLVFGAINQDEVARVSRHPQPGETVVTDSIDFFPGGKGANQAYAAAVAGRGEIDVQMVGAVGGDTAGDEALASLQDVGVDTTLVKQVVGRPTGRAYIAVADNGQNSIVVGLGANAFVSPSNLVLAQRPDVAVAQSELGATAVEALCDFARKSGSRLVINNGPVVPLTPETLTTADPLIVNEHEAIDMLTSPTWTGEPSGLAETIRARYGARSVVVTLGSRGAAIADASGSRLRPAARAQSVLDTTGAGDTFVGTLAAALALGADLDHAVEQASTAATASVAWAGARAPLSALAGSTPTRNTSHPNT
ncbi:ribokinase [Microbacterium maritypicum]